mgnify:CR=1 FL=1
MTKPDGNLKPRPALTSQAPEEKHLKEAFYKRYGVYYSATRSLVKKIAGDITLSLREIYNTLVISDREKDRK